MNHPLSLPPSFDDLSPAAQGAGDVTVFVAVIFVLACIIAWGLIVEPLRAWWRAGSSETRAERAQRILETRLQAGIEAPPPPPAPPRGARR